MKTPANALQSAVDILGGQTSTAAAIGPPVTQQHVWYWIKTGQLPAEHCLAVERATRKAGTVVHRYLLRPDVYPQPKNKKLVA